MDSESDRCDAVIGCGQIAAIAGEDHGMPLRPAMGDERFHQPAILRRHVAVEKGPDMVAAGRVAPLDQQQRQIGPQRRQRERGQATGQSAADDRQVAVHLVAHRPLIEGRRA